VGSGADGSDHLRRRGRVGERHAARGPPFGILRAAGLPPADRDVARSGEGRAATAEPGDWRGSAAALATKRRNRRHDNCTPWPSRAKARRNWCSSRRRVRFFGSPTSDAATSTEQRSRSEFGACLALTAARSGVARHLGRRVGQERAADARARVDTLTLDGYGHLSPDVLDDVARRMDAAARHAGVTERVQKRNRCCPRPMVRWQ
jgi:hypothetical protein